VSERLKSGRFRGYSVRRAKPAGPIVVRVEDCSLCRCRFTEDDTERWWISTGRWRSLVGYCPECGQQVEFSAGFVVPREDAA
jgi:hypothetical protein